MNAKVDKTGGWAKQGILPKPTLFIREVLQVFWSVVGLVESVRVIFKRNALRVGLAVLDWARKNPDPLGASRQQMKDLRLKWGEVKPVARGQAPFASERSG
jgi:hypothetical protein